MLQKHITQICLRCKKELPLTDFATNIYNEIQPYCWDCADALFEFAQAREVEWEMEQCADALVG